MWIKIITIGGTPYSRCAKAGAKTYSEPSQTSKMELFVKIVNGWSH